METFLNLYAPIAFAIFVVGVALRMGRWGKALFAGHKPRGLNPGFPVGRRPMGMLAGARTVLAAPVSHFHRRANRTWSRGYALYHAAIITEVASYSLSALILIVRITMGQPVPDMAHHTAQSFNYSPANMLAIVFGNGEALASQFLFGSLAPVVVSITWVAVGFAVVGNLHLVFTLLTRRNGAVLADIDAASRGVRLKGRITWDRLAVRLLIFSIIWTELLARLEVIEGIVFVHAALGLALFTLFPFTYLFHMLFNFVALYYGARRRAIGAVA